MLFSLQYIAIQCFSVLQACFVNSAVAVRRLVASGAELNCGDTDGYTPLMVAVWFQRVEAARWGLDLEVNSAQCSKVQCTVGYII